MAAKYLQQREASTQLILDAGLDLFARRGFETTTIRMIAQQANISLGLLYNYFSSKADLLQAIIRNNLQEMQVNFLSFPPEDQIAIGTYIRQLLRMYKNNKNFWRVYYSTRLQPSTTPALKEEIKRYDEALGQQLEAILVRTEVSFPGLEAKLLLATLEGIIHQYLLLDNFPVDDVANLLIIKYQNPFK